MTATSATVAWNKTANATNYQVRVTYQGKLVKSTTTSATSASVFGLTPDHTYTFHIAATGPGGTSSETNGPVVKTPKS